VHLSSSPRTIVNKTELCRLGRAPGGFAIPRKLRDRIIFVRVKEFYYTMKLLPSFSLVLLLSGISMSAAAQSCTTAVCNAASPNEADVLAALPSSGNTNATVVVNIPSGSAAWSAGFTYTIPSAVTSLTIKGATAVNCSGTAGSSSYACVASDSTIIQDVYQSNNALMTFNVGSSSSLFRVTGLTVAGGSIGSSSYSKYNGLIEVYSGAAQVRIDHNHANETTYSPAIASVFFRTYGSVIGVADHNLLDLANNNSSYPFGFSDFAAYGDSIGNGDGTFAHPTPWGASTSFYVENNVQNGGVIDDCGNAGALVIRYNNINDASVGIQTHGTKSPAGPARGCRSIEMYNNYFTGPSGSSQASAAVGTKGATALIWNNTVASGYYRFYQGGGDRQSGDEAETAAPNGWGYCGTAVGGNGVGSAWDGNQNSTTGYPCLDGLGRGQTPQSLNGASFPSRLNSASGTISWPKQYLEPQYLWNNALDSGASSYMLLSDGSVNNQDYYYDCGSWNSSCSGGFTGVAGTGYGSLANRPTTCTAGGGGTYLTSPTGSYGVAYFATDANSGNGELYVCTAANTWTGIYQPYVYPHPLESGSTTSASPPAPTNLTGTVVQ